MGRGVELSDWSAKMLGRTTGSVKITAKIADEAATITMTRAEALVLFEFLSRFDRDEQLDVRDKAEELVLWHVHGAFERVLAEPFTADYLKRLETARETVRHSA